MGTCNSCYEKLIYAWTVLTGVVAISSNLSPHKM